MRRTVLSALALAGTAVLAGAVPAFADGEAPSQVPTTRPVDDTKPSAVPSEATPSKAPETGPSKATDTRTPSAVPPRDKRDERDERGQVGVRPEGAPDTGVAPVSAESGGDGMLIGTGAAAFAAGGAALFVVRRRRATGA